MKQYSLRYLYANLGKALEDLPFEITSHNKVIAIVHAVDTIHGTNQIVGDMSIKTIPKPIDDEFYSKSEPEILLEKIRTSKPSVETRASVEEVLKNIEVEEEVDEFEGKLCPFQDPRTGRVCKKQATNWYEDEDVGKIAVCEKHLPE